KSRPVHPALRFLILHELFPYESRAVVFRHQHRNAQVYAENIGVVPSSKRVKGVTKAVFCPDAVSVCTAQISQHLDAVVKQKGKRAAGCARYDAAINGALRRRSAPSRVALFIIRGADAPETLVVIRKSIAQRKAK